LSEPTVNIVGVGNVLMGDDGAGIAAARRLADAGMPTGVRLHDAGLAVADVLGGLDPAVPLIVLDALQAGGEPGTVYTARLEDLSAGGRLAGLTSLHELSVLPALRLEALSGRTFGDVTVFGVEPARIEWGKGLSDPAAAGVERLVEAVTSHVEQITRDRLAIAGEPLP